MPFAANGQISTDPIEGGISITDEQYQVALAGITEGKLVTIGGGFAVIDPPDPEPPVEPEPPTEADYAAAIQAHVDATAQSQQFNDGVTLASYVASTNPLWASQALAFVAWRDAVWAYVYAEMAKVLAGQRTQPTTAEIIAELPAISWS
ncbi:hypothetical protein [Ferirhizobium litorale]|uniref:Uncharacterized protein n=1 Tax=Ferirhizobium litorale TaxID=2927786 RepID=A0AAE3QG91_9HYPH|nr:hypothetical protein [Fererhizobium litorale]MDI7923415.1 hypothetical protein [Fererhizobium litorale]